VASGDAGGTVHVWERQTGKLRHAFPVRRPGPDHDPAVTSLVFASDRTLLAGGKDGSVRLWDVTTGKSLPGLRGLSGWGGGLALAPDGHTLAFAGSDGEVGLGGGVIRFWALDTGKETGAIQAKDEEFGRVAFSPDSKLLAVSRSRVEWHTRKESDHQIILFEVATRRDALRFKTGA
jgi:WD40 repeat protein